MIRKRGVCCFFVYDGHVENESMTQWITGVNRDIELNLAKMFTLLKYALTM